MARGSEKTVKVYEVGYYAGDDGPAGPGGDGIFIARFRSKTEADRFAIGKTMYAGPARVDTIDAPFRLARRWGLA